MPINNKVQKLYGTMKENGADVGTLDEFNKWFTASGDQGYANRKKVYDTFKANGADVGKNYEEFRDWLGIKPSKPQTTAQRAMEMGNAHFGNALDTRGSKVAETADKVDSKKFKPISESVEDTVARANQTVKNTGNVDALRSTIGTTPYQSYKVGDTSSDQIADYTQRKVEAGKLQPYASGKVTEAISKGKKVKNDTMATGVLSAANMGQQFNNIKFAAEQGEDAMQDAVDQIDWNTILKERIMSPDGQRYNYDIRSNAKKRGMSEDEYVNKFVIPSMGEAIQDELYGQLRDEVKVKGTADYITRKLMDGWMGAIVKGATTTKMQRQIEQDVLGTYEQGQGFGTKVLGIAASTVGDTPLFLIGGGAGNLALKGASKGAGAVLGGAGNAVAKAGATKVGQVLTNLAPKTTNWLMPNIAKHGGAQFASRYENYLLANMSKPQWYGRALVRGGISGAANMGTFMGTKSLTSQLSIGDDTSGSELLKCFFLGMKDADGKRQGGLVEGMEMGGAMALTAPAGQLLQSYMSRGITRFVAQMAGKVGEIGTFTGVDYLHNLKNDNWKFTDSIVDNTAMIIGMAFGTHPAQAMAKVGGVARGAFYYKTKVEGEDGKTTEKWKFNPIKAWHDFAVNSFVGGQSLQKAYRLTKEDKDTLRRVYPDSPLTQILDIKTMTPAEQKAMEATLKIDSEWGTNLSGEIFASQFSDVLQNKQNIPWDLRNKISIGLFGVGEASKPLTDSFAIRGDRVRFIASDGSLISDKTFKGSDELQAIMTKERLSSEHERVTNMLSQLTVRDDITDTAKDAAEEALLTVATENGVKAEDVFALSFKDPMRMSEKERNMYNQLGTYLIDIIKKENAGKWSEETSREIGKITATNSDPVHNTADNAQLAQMLENDKNELVQKLNSMEARRKQILQDTGKDIADFMSEEEVDNFNLYADDKEFAKDYIRTRNDAANAQATYDGFVEAMGNDINQDAELMYQTIMHKGAINGQKNGMVVSVSDGEKEYYLLVGDVDSGRVVDNGSHMVTVRNKQTGEREYLDPRKLQIVGEPIDKETAISPYITSEQERVTAELGIGNEVQAPEENADQATAEVQTQGTAEPIATEETATETAQPSALESIPNDGKKYDFNHPDVTPEQRAQALVERHGDIETVKRLISNNIKKHEADVKKLRTKIENEIDSDKLGEEQASLAEAERLLDAWSKTRDVLEMADKATEEVKVEEPVATEEPVEAEEQKVEETEEKPAEEEAKTEEEFTPEEIAEVEEEVKGNDEETLDEGFEALKEGEETQDDNNTGDRETGTEEADTESKGEEREDAQGDTVLQETQPDVTDGTEVGGDNRGQVQSGREGDTENETVSGEPSDNDGGGVEGAEHKVGDKVTFNGENTIIVGIDEDGTIRMKRDVPERPKSINDRIQMSVTQNGNYKIDDIKGEDAMSERLSASYDDRRLIADFDELESGKVFDGQYLIVSKGSDTDGFKFVHARHMIGGKERSIIIRSIPGRNGDCFTLYFNRNLSKVDGEMIMKALAKSNDKFVNARDIEAKAENFAREIDAFLKQGEDEILTWNPNKKEVVETKTEGDTSETVATEEERPFKDFDDERLQRNHDFAVQDEAELVEQIKKSEEDLENYQYKLDHADEILEETTRVAEEQRNKLMDEVDGRYLDSKNQKKVDKKVSDIENAASEDAERKTTMRTAGGLAKYLEEKKEELSDILDKLPTSEDESTPWNDFLHRFESIEDVIDTINDHLETIREADADYKDEATRELKDYLNEILDEEGEVNIKKVIESLEKLSDINEEVLDKLKETEDALSEAEIDASEEGRKSLQAEIDSINKYLPEDKQNLEATRKEIEQLKAEMERRKATAEESKEEAVEEKPSGETEGTVTAEDKAEETGTEVAEGKEEETINTESNEETENTDIRPDSEVNDGEGRGGEDMSEEDRLFSFQGEELEGLEEKDKDFLNTWVKSLRKSIGNTSLRTMESEAKKLDDWNNIAYAGLSPKEKIRYKKYRDILKYELAKRDAWARENGIINGELTIDSTVELFNRLNGDEALGKLAEKVFEVARKFNPTIKLTRQLSTGALGNCGVTDGIVKYNFGFFQNPSYDAQRKANVLIHELIHSATNYAIHSYELILRGKTQYWDALTDGQKEAVRDLYNIFCTVKQKPSDFIDKDGSTAYGLTDAYEFAAEMANGEFREQLKKKNLWVKFKDAVKRFFGFEKEGATQSTAYDEAMKALDYILEHPNEDVYEAIKSEYRGRSRKTAMIGGKRKVEMDSQLAKKRPDMSEEQRKQTIAEIEKIGEKVKEGGDPKTEKLAQHWVLKGNLILPEDEYKLLDAMDVAQKKGIDPFTYDNPTKLLMDNSDVKPSVRKTNPDTIKVFSNKKEGKGGLVIYDVENSKEGQKAVRQMIDEHWGEDANPWCLAARHGEGDVELSRAWQMWNHYDAQQKRIAFLDGELIGFCATDREGVTQWWDRLDDANEEGITIKSKSGKKKFEATIDEDGNFVKYKKIYSGEEGKDGYYREYDTKNPSKVIRYTYTQDGRVYEEHSFMNENDAYETHSFRNAFGDGTNMVSFQSYDGKRYLSEIQDENALEYSKITSYTVDGDVYEVRVFPDHLHRSSMPILRYFGDLGYYGDPKEVNAIMGDAELSMNVGDKDFFIIKKGYSDNWTVRYEGGKWSVRVNKLGKNIDGINADGVDYEISEDIANKLINSSWDAYELNRMYHRGEIGNDYDSIMKQALDDKAYAEKKYPEGMNIQGNENYRFREEEGKGANIRTSIARSTMAKSVIDSLGGKGNVVSSIEEVKDERVRKAIESGRNIKGWYDTKTGEVHIYLPNCTSEYDVKKTIFHEKVAHEGLRNLMGEKNFNQFLHKVFNGMDAESKRKLYDLAGRRGWDFNKAIDEYLADKAEDFADTPENRTFWQKVKDVFNDALSALGLNGSSMTENDIRTALWLSKNKQANKEGSLEYKMRKAAFEAKLKRNTPREEMNANRTEFADGTKGVKKESDPIFGVSFSEDITPIGRAAREKYENDLKRIGFLWTEAWHNNMESMRILQEAIAGGKENVKDYANVIAAENAMSSKSMQEQEFFKRTHAMALTDALVKAMPNFDGKDSVERRKAVETYLIAKHGLERNRVQTVRKEAFRLSENAKKRLESATSELDTARKELERATNAQMNAKTEGETTIANFRARTAQDHVASAERKVMNAERDSQIAKDMITVMNEERARLGQDLRDGKIKLDEYYTKFDEVVSKMLATSNINASINAKLKAGDEASVAEATALKKAFDKERARLERELKAGNIGARDYMDAIGKFAQDNGIMGFRAGGNDKSGLSDAKYDIWSNGDGTYDDAKAIAHVMEMEDKMGAEVTNQLWSSIKGATEYIKNHDYQCGLISKSQKETMDNMFDWYIPLRGFDETTAEDSYGYINGSTAYAGTSDMHMRGRKSAADTPIATICAMADASIMRGNRNKMKQAFATLVDENPSDLVTETDSWYEYDEVEDGWRAIHPKITPEMSADEIVAEIKRFNADLAEKMEENPDNYVRQKDIKGDVPFRVIDQNRDMPQHMITVKVNGSTRTFIINSHPRAAQAINGMLADQKNHKVLAKWNNWLSQACTTLDPTFIARNGVRDAEFAEAFLGCIESAKYVGKYDANYLKLMGNVANKDGMIKLFKAYRNSESSNQWLDKYPTFADYKKDYPDAEEKNYLNEKKRCEKERLDMTDETHKFFKEYMDNGGMTGYVQLNKVDRWDMNIDEMIKNLESGENAISKFMKGYGNALETVGEAIENHTRFATYMTSRQMGRTVQRSIQDAKNVSVNFNRKGAGNATLSMKFGEVGKLYGINRWAAANSAHYLRNYIIFANAGIQGMGNYYKAAKASPAKFALNMMTLPMAASAFAPLASMMIANWVDGDDDKKRFGENPYAQLPDYERRQNFCLYMGHGKFVKIPLAIELRAAYGMGDVLMGQTLMPELANQVTDKERWQSTAEDVAGALFSQFSQITPIDASTGWKAFVPSAAAPFVDAFKNESWTGAPISNQNNYNRFNAQWTKAGPNTNEMTIRFGKVVNEALGGHGEMRPEDKVARTIEEYLDPAKLQYVLEQETGGLGKMFTEISNLTYNTIDAFRNDDTDKIVDRAWNAITTGADPTRLPITKAFVKTSNPRNALTVAKSQYYALRDEAEETKARLQENTKLAQQNDLNAQNWLRNEMNVRPKIAKMNVINSYSGALKEAQQAKNATDDPRQKAVIQEAMNMMIMRCVKDAQEAQDAAIKMAKERQKGE